MTSFDMEQEFHPVQIAAWKTMGTARKHALVRQANSMIRSAARARIARRNPSMTPQEIEREVSRFIAAART